MNNNQPSKYYYCPIEDNSKLTVKDVNLKDVVNDKKGKSQMTIAIIAASGASGRMILEHALESGHKVIAAVRNPSLLESYKDQIEIRQINLADAKSITTALKGADVVVSALGNGGLLEARKPTTLFSDSIVPIIDAMKHLNIKRLIVISAGGIDYDCEAPSYFNSIIQPFFLMNTYMDIMKMETIIEYHGSSLDWTIVRPTYLTGTHSKNFDAVDRIVGGPHKISRTDVGKFIINEIENDLWIHKHPTLSY